MQLWSMEEMNDYILWWTMIIIRPKYLMVENIWTPLDSNPRLDSVPGSLGSGRSLDPPPHRPQSRRLWGLCVLNSELRLALLTTRLEESMTDRGRTPQTRSCFVCVDKTDAGICWPAVLCTLLGFVVVLFKDKVFLSYLLRTPRFLLLS